MYVVKKEQKEVATQEERDFEKNKKDYTFKPNIQQSLKRATKYGKVNHRAEGSPTEARAERLSHLAQPRTINKPKEKPQPPSKDERSSRGFSKAKTDELSRPKTAVVRKVGLDPVPEKKVIPQRPKEIKEKSVSQTLPAEKMKVPVKATVVEKKKEEAKRTATVEKKSVTLAKESAKI